MKVSKILSVGLVVSSFVGVLVGCTADSSGGEEQEQGSAALANGGPSTSPAPGNTIMKVDPPPPEPSTDRPTASSSTGHVIQKVPPPGPTPASSPIGSPTTSNKHCTTITQQPIGPDGCPVDEVCCASPVFGHAPICIAGDVCPKLP